MEEQVTKAPNKKVFFAAIAVLVIVILFALVSMASSVSRKPQNSVESSIQKNVEKSEVSGSSPVPSAIVQIPAEWKTYQNSQFSMSYPPNWQIEELIFPNKETGTAFYPAVASAKSPSVLITGSIGTVNSIQEKQQDYKSLGFKSSNTLVDNMPAIKLSGAVPERTLADKGLDVTEATHIYVKKGDTDYLLKYMYTDKVINTELESLFGKMIASFRFN